MKRIVLLALALALAALPASAQVNLPNISGNVLAVVGVGTGTTGAVTATLPAVAGKLTFICGFDVSAAGSGSVSPITVTGLNGGTFTYQGVSAPGTFQHPFWPCIPASAINGTVVISTTADATATAVDVQAWGFQQ